MEPYHHQNMHDPRFPMHLPPQPYHLNLNENRRGGGRRRPGAKLSTDPQSVAARERRHRISDRFRVLRSLVPGGSKMDTVSMLEQAIDYVQFLKAQIRLQQTALMLHDQESGHGFDADATTSAEMMCASGHGANDGLGCDELMLPVQEVVSYDTTQVVQVDPGQSSSHDLLPLPACFFLEEAAPCFSSALQGGETDVTGSY